MPKKIFMITTCLLVLFNSFYGCTGLTREPVVKSYYDLNLQPSVSDPDKISKGDPLLIKEFSITPPFDTHSFVYRVGEDKYTNDFYAEFISYPAKLITEKITEALIASIYFSPVITSMKPDINLRLSGKITRLYGDLQTTDDPKAVIEIRMTLETKTDKTFKETISHTYRFEEPIPSRTPAHLVSGWNKGLTKIVTAFIRDFKSPAAP